MTPKSRLRRVFVAYDRFGEAHFGTTRELADVAAAKVSPRRKKRKNPRKRRTNFADPGLDRRQAVR